MNCPRKCSFHECLPFLSLPRTALLTQICSAPFCVTSITRPGTIWYSFNSFHDPCGRLRVLQTFRLAGCWNWWGLLIVRLGSFVMVAIIKSGSACFTYHSALALHSDANKGSRIGSMIFPFGPQRNQCLRPPRFFSVQLISKSLNFLRILSWKT